MQGGPERRTIVVCCACIWGRTMQNRIKEIRQAKKVAGQDLAKAIGVSPSQLSRMENGKRRLNDEWIPKIAAYLGVSVGELFDENAGTGLTAEDRELIVSLFADLETQMRATGQPISSKAILQQALGEYEKRRQARQAAIKAEVSSLRPAQPSGFAHTPGLAEPTDPYKSD